MPKKNNKQDIKTDVNQRHIEFYNKYNSKINELYNIYGDHNEIIMDNINIESIWVKPYVSKEIKETLKAIAKELNCFYMEVDKRK